eukprot:11047531-Lingulodinium_polyedra.AAC.1
MAANMPPAMFGGSVVYDDEHKSCVDMVVKQNLEGARWERPVRISPKLLPASLLRHTQQLYTM